MWCREVIKDLTVFSTRGNESFNACIKKFLEDVSADHFPKVGVIGIAGAVQNNCVSAVNIGHWAMMDGNQIAKDFNLDSFLFINDFEAAAYGVSTL